MSYLKGAVDGALTAVIVMTKRPVQEQLASIEGLTLADCLEFFDSKATARDKLIASLVDTDDEDFECDNFLVSESELSEDNGAYVLGWRWASFEGTSLDKNKDEVEGE